MRPLTVRVVIAREEPPSPRSLALDIASGVVLIVLIASIVRNGRR